MTDEEPDYTNCTLDELRDIRRVIDAQRHPERAKTVGLLIREKEAKAQNEPIRVSIADEDGNIAAVKPGRGVSFGRGIIEIASALIFLAVVFGGFVDLSNPNMKAFAAFAIFASAAGVGGGIFHLYNAFAARRFTEHDIVAPGKEPDPFGRFIDKE